MSLVANFLPIRLDHQFETEAEAVAAKLILEKAIALMARGLPVYVRRPPFIAHIEVDDTWALKCRISVGEGEAGLFWGMGN